MTTFSLILPVYNQADIITPVYKQIYQAIKALGISFEIILVENGSTDGTEKITASLSKKYPHTASIRTTKGYGSAVISGLEKTNGQYVCYMPSDGQVDLSVLPELWKVAQTGKYEIVKVKRLHRESVLRTFTSTFFSFVLSLRFGTPRVDINGSPRILKTQNIKSLGLTYRDSFIDAEMLIKAKAQNWNIKEIPMENLPRTGGVSSRSWKTYTEFIYNLATYGRNHHEIRIH